MLKANNFGPFRVAVMTRSTMVNFLLSFPSIFSYAKSRQREYSYEAYSFLSKRLNALRLQKSNLEQSQPNAVFDIDDLEEA